MTRSLGSVCMILEYGLDDYLLVVYVLYWGTE